MFINDLYNVSHVYNLCFYRRKSKQALRDYKKVLLQLETLEINVGDQCRKEFTGGDTLYIQSIINIIHFIHRLY